jgi:hypothetical protein
MPAKAKESAQISKARQKIKQKIVAQNKRTTPQALAEMSKMIHMWLYRHARERINLKDKEVSLFDGNKHSAHLQSKFVFTLLRNIKKDIKKESPSKSLGGRVKTDSST